MPRKDGNGRGATKRARSSFYLPPRPVEDFMGLTKLTDVQKDKWVKLNHRNRELRVTKFLDMEVLEKLGLEVGVRRLMREVVGLEGFLGKNAAVYKRYTLEFLSTLELVNENGVKSITFHLNDHVRTLTYIEMRKILGVVEPFGDCGEKGKLGEIFFYELTSKPMEKGYMVSNSLTHPVWRLFFRGLSMTFFGKGEPTQMNSFEVSVIRTAIPGMTIVLDWVDIFITKCLTLADKGSGNVSVGGMITLLVEKFIKKHPEAREKVGGPSFYDFGFLRRYEGFQTIPGDKDAMNFVANGGALRVRCSRQSIFPMGLTPKEWRMPGVLDLDVSRLRTPRGDGDDLNAEEQVEDDVEMRDPVEDKQEGHHQEMDQQQQDGMFDWEMMRAYIDEKERQRVEREQAQEVERQSREMRRYELEDYRWGELYDRVEGIEDTQAFHGARFTQLEMWASQAKPRQYEPVPEEYIANMESRAEARRQRAHSRRSYFDGPSTSGL